MDSSGLHCSCSWVRVGLELPKNELLIFSFLEGARPGFRSWFKLGIGGGRGGMDSSALGCSISLSDSKTLGRFPVRFVLTKLELGDPV